MPRYIVNTPQFQPFEGLQEALNTYKVAFDKYDNLYNTLDLNASPVGTQIQNDPEALAIYNQWQADLQAGTDALAKGLSLDDYALAKQVQRSYNDNVLRLNAAVSAKAADVEQYNKLNAQAVASGDKLIGTDPTNNKVSAYLDGNKPTSHLVSANGIYKVAKDQAIAAAARYVTTSTGKMFNNEYYKLTKERGIPGGVAIDMLLKSGKYPELNKAFTDTYNQFAIGNLDTDDQKANAVSALYAGLAAGLSYDKDVKPYVDHVAAARASSSVDNNGGIQSPWIPRPHSVTVNGKSHSGTDVKNFLEMLNDPRLSGKLANGFQSGYSNVVYGNAGAFSVRTPNNSDYYQNFKKYVKEFGFEKYLNGFDFTVPGKGKDSKGYNIIFDDHMIDYNGMKQALLSSRQTGMNYQYDLYATSNDPIMYQIDKAVFDPKNSDKSYFTDHKGNEVSAEDYNKFFFGQERQASLFFDDDSGQLKFRVYTQGDSYNKKHPYYDVKPEGLDLANPMTYVGGPSLTNLFRIAEQAHATGNREYEDASMDQILKHIASFGFNAPQVRGGTSAKSDFDSPSIYYGTDD